jgi:hypothetical protein
VEPRIVLVRRETEFEALLKEHGTPQMVRFQLKNRGTDPQSIFDQHHTVLAHCASALGQVPTTWRKTHLLRSDLDRFRFDPGDVIVAVGWDGLIPNVAKYLQGQRVIGVNPFEPVQQMMHYRHTELSELYRTPADRWRVQARDMVEVTLDDGRKLTALNELFCGHRSHQSAKYWIEADGEREYQSSSGIIITTGTGASGWAQSIAQTMGLDPPDWRPEVAGRNLQYFVREAWASNRTGATIVVGRVPKEGLVVRSMMQEGGLVFGDGIESDHLVFHLGQTARFMVSDQALNLVVPAKKKGKRVKK